MFSIQNVAWLAPRRVGAISRRDLWELTLIPAGPWPRSGSYKGRRWLAQTRRGLFWLAVRERVCGFFAERTADLQIRSALPALDNP